MNTDDEEVVSLTAFTFQLNAPFRSMFTGKGLTRVHLSPSAVFRLEDSRKVRCALRRSGRISAATQPHGTQDTKAESHFLSYHHGHIITDKKECISVTNSQQGARGLDAGNATNELSKNINNASHRQPIRNRSSGASGCSQKVGGFPRQGAVPGGFWNPPDPVAGPVHPPQRLGFETDTRLCKAWSWPNRALPARVNSLWRGTNVRPLRSASAVLRNGRPASQSH